MYQWRNVSFRNFVTVTFCFDVIFPIHNNFRLFLLFICLHFLENVEKLLVKAKSDRFKPSGVFACELIVEASSSVSLYDDDSMRLNIQQFWQSTKWPINAFTLTVYNCFYSLFLLINVYIYIHTCIFKRIRVYARAKSKSNTHIFLVIFARVLDCTPICIH